MTVIRAAFGLLTRLPTAGVDTPGVAAFGLVGATVGLVAALPLLVLPAMPLVAGGLSVAALAVVSGVMHLDGLADTADALAASPAGRAETARADPRVGTAGAAAVAVVVLLDSAILAAIVERGGALAGASVVVVAAAGSRALLPLIAWFGRGRVRAPSSAAWLADRASPPAVTISLASAALAGLLGCLVAGSVVPLVGLLVGSVLGSAGAGWLMRARGGLDGDLLGAAAEMAFAAIALAAALVYVIAGPADPAAALPR